MYSVKNGEPTRELNCGTTICSGYIFVAEGINSSEISERMLKVYRSNSLNRLNVYKLVEWSCKCL